MGTGLFLHSVKESLMRRWSIPLMTLAVLALAFALPAAALADLAPPWNGQPISHGLGPTR